MCKQISSRLIFSLITLIALIILFGCQSSAPTEANCPTDEVLCVGLVTSLSGIEDMAFNQATWEGMLSAKTQKAVDWVYYIETVDSKDYELNITTLAVAGYDVIVTVGNQFSEVTINAAKSYPNILFIGVDQALGDVLPNLVGLAFHNDQSGFLAGALAARMTKNNTIAVVLDGETEAAMGAYEEGYEIGARYIKPEINIISSYRPDDLAQSISAPRWGANAAAQAIQNGADVVFAAGETTGYGALIETASHPGLFCIGNDIDQWENVSEAHPCLISSAIKLVKPAVFDILKLTKDGAFPSGIYYGSSSLAPYHDFESVIPQGVKDTIDQITTSLSDGSITTGFLPIK